MKVIYVPVTIPLNIRTFVSMGLLLFAGILTLGAVISNGWFSAYVDVTKGSITSADNQASYITHLALRQGLQVVNIDACFRAVDSMGVISCANLHVNYMQCSLGSDDEYTWCEGRSPYLAVFALSLIAAIVGMIGWAIALYREKWLLYPAALNTLLTFLSAVIYFATYLSAVNGSLYPSIRKYASLGDGVVFVSSLGSSYGILWIAFASNAIALGLSASVLWSKKQHDVEPVIFTSDLPVGTLPETEGVDISNATFLQFDTNSSFIMDRHKHPEQLDLMTAEGIGSHNTTPRAGVRSPRGPRSPLGFATQAVRTPQGRQQARSPTTAAPPKSAVVAVKSAPPPAASTPPPPAAAAAQRNRDVSKEDGRGGDDDEEELIVL